MTYKSKIHWHPDYTVFIKFDIQGTKFEIWNSNKWRRINEKNNRVV